MDCLLMPLSLFLTAVRATWLSRCRAVFDDYTGSGAVPTARSERSDATRAGLWVSSQRSEREQAIEEGAIASQRLPQILGAGLLAV
jgi:hypothetical protein